MSEEIKEIILQQENERLKATIKDLKGTGSIIRDFQDFQDYKSRNEKAIELVKSLIIFWKKYSPDNTMEIGQFENVLSTLQGSDKE